MSRFDETMGGSPVISCEGREVLRARVFDRSFNGESFDAHDCLVRSCRAIHTASSFPPLVSCAATLTVVAPRHSAAASHRAVMGIKRRPVERPVEHACAEAPRAPRN